KGWAAGSFGGRSRRNRTCYPARAACTNALDSRSTGQRVWLDALVAFPVRTVDWGPNWRTSSSNSTVAFGGQTLGSTIAGPPSLEEAVGGLAQQFAELVPQRQGQVGVDLRGSQARMPEQDLD